MAKGDITSYGNLSLARKKKEENTYFLTSDFLGQDYLCRHHWAPFTGNVHFFWDQE